MTVTVTLPDGVTDKYMRFGDAYVKHDDGRLDVVRGGAKQRPKQCADAADRGLHHQLAGRLEGEGVRRHECLYHTE